MSRVTSNGVASAREAEVQEQLKAKFPARFQELPDTVLQGQPVENLRGLRDALVRLQRGVAPGCGGCRGDYLAQLGVDLEEAEMMIKSIVLSLISSFYKLNMHPNHSGVLRNATKTYI